MKLNKVKKPNQRGISLIIVAIVILASIALLVIFSNPKLMASIGLGLNTAKFSDQMTQIQQSLILDQKTGQEAQFQMTLEDTAGYSYTFFAPPVRATHDITTLKLPGGKEVKLNQSKVSPTSGSLRTYVKDKGVVTFTTPTEIATIARPGYDGFSQFVNYNIPDIDKELFSSLLGGQGTSIASELEQSGTYQGFDYSDFVKMIIGDSTDSTHNFDKKAATTYKPGWFTMVQLNSDYLREKMDIKVKLTDTKQYTLYVVKGVESLPVAMERAKDYGFNVNNPEVKRHLTELYNNMRQILNSNAIVAMPADIAFAVRNKSSDFQQILFTIADYMD